MKQHSTATTNDESVQSIIRYRVDQDGKYTLELHKLLSHHIFASLKGHKSFSQPHLMRTSGRDQSISVHFNPALYYAAPTSRKKSWSMNSIETMSRYRFNSRLTKIVSEVIGLEISTLRSLLRSYESYQRVLFRHRYRVEQKAVAQQQGCLNALRVDQVNVPDLLQQLRTVDGDSTQSIQDMSASSSLKRPAPSSHHLTFNRFLGADLTILSQRMRWLEKQQVILNHMLITRRQFLNESNVLARDSDNHILATLEMEDSVESSGSWRVSQLLSELENDAVTYKDMESGDLSGDRRTVSETDKVDRLQLQLILTNLKNHKDHRTQRMMPGVGSDIFTALTSLRYGQYDPFQGMDLVKSSHEKDIQTVVDKSPDTSGGGGGAFVKRSRCEALEAGSLGLGIIRTKLPQPISFLARGTHDMFANNIIPDLQTRDMFRGLQPSTKLAIGTTSGYTFTLSTMPPGDAFADIEKSFGKGYSDDKYVLTHNKGTFSSDTTSKSPTLNAWKLRKVLRTASHIIKVKIEGTSGYIPGLIILQKYDEQSRGSTALNTQELPENLRQTTYVARELSPPRLATGAFVPGFEEMVKTLNTEVLGANNIIMFFERKADAKERTTNNETKDGAADSKNQYLDGWYKFSKSPKKEGQWYGTEKTMIVGAIAELDKTKKAKAEAAKEADTTSTGFLTRMGTRVKNTYKSFF